MIQEHPGRVRDIACVDPRLDEYAHQELFEPAPAPAGFRRKELA